MAPFPTLVIISYTIGHGTGGGRGEGGVLKIPASGVMCLWKDLAFNLKTAEQVECVTQRDEKAKNQKADKEKIAITVLSLNLMIFK